MVTKEKLKRAHEYDFRKAIEIKDFTPVKGYDFSKTFNFKDFLKSFGTTGFQATNLDLAIGIIKKMRKENVRIILTYTSNLITSGLRDVIAYLVKNKFVHVLCTTGGGIEEDIMKCFKSFAIGDFRGDSKELYTKGLNRTGNIYVSDRIYMEFEKFLLPILEKFYKRQIEENKIVGTPEFIHELGKQINNESSILYWAAKNNIPVFSPALLDGAIGDIVWFFKYNHPDFKIDMTDDVFGMNNIPVESNETGIIALGSGTPRHYALNSNIFRGGTKYAVYINSGNEWDGSTSSSRPNEAYTWGKIKLSKPFEKNSVEVAGDATIIFPLIVAGVFI
jgi:deoxyhypusine synthase